jgi:hypothetical protein
MNDVEYSRRYREIHRDEIRRRRQADPEKYAERNRRWREANPGAMAANGRKWNQANRQAVFGHYGWSCACCGSADDLTIDHVKPREGAKLAGSALYRRLIADGFPAGFQTLCRRCNRSKARGERCRLDHAARVVGAVKTTANGHATEED